MLFPLTAVVTAVYHTGILLPVYRPDGVEGPQAKGKRTLGREAEQAKEQSLRRASIGGEHRSMCTAVDMHL